MRLYDGAYVRFAQDIQVNLDSHIGKKSREWPHIRDGVYVVVRANAGLSESIWGNILNKELPEEVCGSLESRCARASTTPTLLAWPDTH
jgi:hypothetical protein